MTSIEESAVKFSKQYKKLMTNSHEALKKFDNMSYVSLSTMTIICNLSRTIDIKQLSLNFKSPVYPVCILKHTKAHDEYELTKRGKTKKSFYNQVTIQYQDVTTKSIKLFSNGRLQMTGMTSIADAHRAANVVCQIIKNISNELNEYIDIVPIELTVGMINSNFSFGTHLNILKLKSDIEQFDDVHITYDPEVYPGLKIKHRMSDDSYCSIFVFSTGNIVMTGVKDLSFIIHSFDFLCSAVNTIHFINRNFPKPVKRERKLISQTHLFGYPKHLYEAYA